MGMFFDPVSFLWQQRELWKDQRYGGSLVEAAPPPHCAAPLPFDEFSGGQWRRGARYQLLSLLGHCAKGKANRQRSFVMPPQNRTL